MERFGHRAVAVAALTWVTAIAGCTDNKTTIVQTPDGGILVAQPCTPNAKSCFDNTTATACTADGKALLAIPCGAGNVCQNGACQPDSAVACTPAQNTCMDGTTAMQCASSGKGFMVVTCPTNTVCTGAGYCQGACVVGTSYCSDNGTLATCVDGFGYTATACGSGMNCVNTTPPGVTDENLTSAACKTSGCTPVSSQCGDVSEVCGNKVDPSAPNQGTTVSECVETPNGYQWAVVQTCTGGSVCNPTQNDCNGQKYAGCTQTQCTPGQTACSNGGYPYVHSYQTCLANGTWSPQVTECGVDSTTNQQYACVNEPTGAVCGDLVCASGNAGVCDGAGKYHACGTDGKVSATATACTSGTCTPVSVDGNSSSAGTVYVPGACVSQCNEGDQRCIGYYGTDYQVCTNGVWGTAVACASPKLCFNTPSTSGAQAITCADCLDGQTECDYDTNPAQIRTCANKTWGAPTACTAGTCRYSYDNYSQIAYCGTDCIPGTMTCQSSEGGVTQDPTSGLPVADSVQLCKQDGTLGPVTKCGAGTYCRTGPSSNPNNNSTPDGVVLGCLTCVGTQNAFGMADSRCVDNGNSTQSVQVCGSDNTWNTTAIDICDYSQTSTNYQYCAQENSDSPNDGPSPAHCDDGD